MRLTVMIWQRLLYGDRIYRLEAEFCFKDQTIHVVTSDVLRLEISRGDLTLMHGKYSLMTTPFSIPVAYLP